MNEQLQKLDEAGVVESVPDDEPTTWISPLVTQSKKAVGERRICVDMRKPNEAMLHEKRKFSTVENIVQELNGAVKFSKLDLNDWLSSVAIGCWILTPDHILHTVGARTLPPFQLWNCHCTRGVS